MTHYSLGLSLITSLLSTSLALSSLACLPELPGTTDPSTPIAMIPQAELPQAVRDRVLAQASQDANTPIAELQITAYSAQTWSDGCLGLGGPAEGCAAVMTEGWQVEVSTPRGTMMYRTDATAMSIRQESSDQPDRPQSALPAPVRDRVLTEASQATNTPMADLQITTYSAETWSDGCLGLGGPAELCLAAITPGWQVEVTTPTQTLVYRTDATAMAIRRDMAAAGSDRLAQPIRDRLLEQVSDRLDIPAAQLTITQVEDQLWNGCLGLTPSVNTPCTEIGIPGWRVVVSDSRQYWVFHVDQQVERLELNNAVSPTDVAIQFSPRQDPRSLGDETVFQMQISGGIVGEMRQYLLENDGRVILLQSSPNARYAPQVINQLSEAELQAFIEQLDTQGFHNMDGVAYLPRGGADLQTVTLQTRYSQTQYVDFVRPGLSPNLQAILAEWDQMIQVETETEAEVRPGDRPRRPTVEPTSPSPRETQTRRWQRRFDR